MTDTIVAEASPQEDHAPPSAQELAAELEIRDVELLQALVARSMAAQRLHDYREEAGLPRRELRDERESITTALDLGAGQLGRENILAIWNEILVTDRLRRQPLRMSLNA